MARQSMNHQDRQFHCFLFSSLLFYKLLIDLEGVFLCELLRTID